MKRIANALLDAIFLTIGWVIMDWIFMSLFGLGPHLRYDEILVLTTIGSWLGRGNKWIE